MLLTILTCSVIIVAAKVFAAAYQGRKLGSVGRARPSRVVNYESTYRLDRVQIYSWSLRRRVLACCEVVPGSPAVELAASYGLGKQRKEYVGHRAGNHLAMITRADSRLIM